MGPQESSPFALKRKADFRLRGGALAPDSKTWLSSSNIINRHLHNSYTSTTPIIANILNNNQLIHPTYTNMVKTRSGLDTSVTQQHKKSPNRIIPHKLFADLKKEDEGLVFYGCGEDLNEWVDDILSVLEGDGLATKASFKDVYYVKDGGRIDLVFPFASASNLNLSRLAMWKLRFGSCSWISDYVANRES